MFTKLVLTTLILSIFLCGGAVAELISIDTVGPQTIGNSFTLSGSTDLPAGTVLHIRILPVDDLGKTDISTGPTQTMIWGDTVIESGPSETIGIWNYTVNTSNLLSTAYFVRVYSDDVKYPYSERSTAFTARLPTQTEPVQTPGFGIVGCVIGCACAVMLLCRRW